MKSNLLRSYIAKRGERAIAFECGVCRATVGCWSRYEQFPRIRPLKRLIEHSSGQLDIESIYREFSERMK